MASRVLEMRFSNELGRMTTIRLPDVKEPFTGTEAASLMDAIIARNIFTSTGGDLVAKETARIVITDVSELELI